MDRIAICEVYYLIECDFNIGGIVEERPDNARRRKQPESIGVQLSRMGFKPSPLLSLDTLDSEQLDYYDQLIDQWGLD